MVNIMNERIKELRKTLRMSQEELGKWLGISKSGVSDIEAGRRKVTEQHIIMLAMHGVNEIWIRSGNGKMLIELDKDDLLFQWVGNVLKDESETFKKKFLTMLSSLTESEWEWLEQKALQLFSDAQYRN